jgi:DNA-binding GntR family transcriptional regulator
MNLKSMEKMNTPQKVAHIIRKQILSGRLKADSHFNEANMAEMLGVSRSPVREAIKLLESEGLLETLRTGRTIVVGFTPTDLVNLYELRFDLEWKAIQPLHKKQFLSIQQMMEIEKLVQAMESCSDDKYAYRNLDVMYHRKLIEASNNRPLIRIWKTMIQTITALQEITNEKIQLDLLSEMNHIHRSILESIKEGNTKETKAFLQTHIQSGVKIVTQVLEENIARNIEIDWLNEGD